MCTSCVVVLACCGAGARASTMCGFALVDLMPFLVFVMCSLMVSVACGKYVEAL